MKNFRAMEAGQRRLLIEILGVEEGDGALALILGLILLGLTVLACLYCKVYDPIMKWCYKIYVWLRGESKEKPPPPPERPPPPEVC